MIDLNKRLRHAMTLAGLSQIQAARDLRIAQSTISKWLTGHLEPRYIHLLALHSLYGINPDYLTDSRLPVIVNSSDRNIFDGARKLSDSELHHERLIVRVLDLIQNMPDEKLEEVITMLQEI